MNDRLITPSCLNTEYRASRRYPLLQKSNALFPYINVKKIPPQVIIKISVANIINTIVSIYIYLSLLTPEILDILSISANL